MSLVPGQWTMGDFTVNGGYGIKLVRLSGVGGIFYRGFLGGFQSIPGNCNFKLNYVMIGGPKLHNEYYFIPTVDFRYVSLLV